MQVSIETMSGLERRMTIVVPSETFEQRITERLSATAQKARIPGFRPGKVPLREVRRRFGAAVRQEVVGELMQSSFVDAIRKESLSPAGQPNLEVLNMDAGGDLEFAATFEVFPSIELKAFADINVERPRAQVTDADIDKMVGTLREQRKHYHEAARAAEDHDRVTIDFKGYLNGELFDGGSGADVAFVMGEGQMIEAFETGVRGHAAGADTSFDATFPEDYRAEHLKGKTVRFDVTVKKVEAPHVPELDEDFFKGFGIEEGGESAFRAEVRANMERELNVAVRNQVKRQVMDELARLHELPLPQSMVSGEVGSLRHQMAHQMGQHAEHDHDHDAHDWSKDMPELPDDFFLAEAKRRVTVGLIMNEIIVKNRFAADPDRVRARIEELAKPYSQPEQVINWYYSNQAQLSQIEMAVLEEQVVDFIIGGASATDVDRSYQEVIAGKAGAGAAESEPTTA